MAPKKKNSFFFFMKAVQEKEADKGRRYSMMDLPKVAHPLWAQMSIVEREPYEELARKHKNDPQYRGPKLASDGTSVAENNKIKEDMLQAENEMRQEINRYISIGMTPEEHIENIKRNSFFFISFNILCRTENECIPIEVGLVQYSILEGITGETHMLLYPVRHIPTGYAGEAKRISESKHKINIFAPEEDSVKDMRIVYEKIKHFINPLQNDEFPPLFCIDDDFDQTKDCLKWIQLKANDREEFVVWKATYLLMQLRLKAGDNVPYSLVVDMLTRPSFNYHPAARCLFHQEEDCHFCALAYSKCLCYLLSDAICYAFKVPLTKNHMPCRAVKDKEYDVIPAKNTQQDLYKPSSSSRARLDNRNNYYESQMENHFEEVKPIQAPKPVKPRQPSTTCMAEEMTRLNLRMAAAEVPGHGIGRGQRRQ